MADLEPVHMGFTNKSLIDQVVRSLVLPVNRLRPPRVWLPTHNATTMNDGESCVLPTALLKDSDPALNRFASNGEFKLLLVRHTRFRFQQATVDLLPRQLRTVPA